MKKLLSIFFILFLSLLHHSYAQTWVSVGSPGFSAGEVGYTSIAIDTGGIPYVVYEDMINHVKATVKKYNGLSWVTVGSVGFSDSTADFTSIAIDRNDTPYVVYKDAGHSNRATVMKFNGINWVAVGSTGFSAGPVAYTSIAIDTNGTPYVAYQDSSYGYKATVMKYNGAGWVTVGGGGLSVTEADRTSIAIDRSGTPYIVYVDYAGIYQGATVMKYNGSSWVIVGSENFSAGSVQYTSIAIDSSGTPYVVYMDGATPNYGPTVMKYNGTNWITVGSPGFGAPPHQVTWTSIAIDVAGTPYVAYSSVASNDKATAMKYNGSSWVNAGNAYFSAGHTDCTSIAIDREGIPYIVYMEDVNDNKATVVKLDTALASITGIGTLCVGTTTVLSDVTGGGIWSSNNTTIATVGTSGIVTGIGAGSTIVFYTVSGNSAIYPVSVDSLPIPGAFVRHFDTVCVGDSAWIENYAVGTWISMDTSIVTITSLGLFTVLTSGMADVGFICTNACGSDTTTYSFLVGSCPNGVNNITNPINSFILSPNPTHNSFALHISSPTKETATIIITNMLGEKVKELTTITNTDTPIQLNSPPGMYFITTITKTETATAKIVVEK